MTPMTQIVTSVFYEWKKQFPAAILEVNAGV